MNFSDQTFEALSKYESYFRTAVDADWCPYPGRDALIEIHLAVDEHDGRKTTQDYACGQCLLRLVKRCGYMYFADKTERETIAAQASALAGTAAALADKEAKTIAAPKKKTSKPRKK